MRKAIVIGATSGIGQELAFLLADHGFCVGITGRRIDVLKEMHCRFPDKFIYKQMDISMPGCSEKLKDLVVDLNGVDLIVICSGVGAYNSRLEFEIEKKAILTNVLGFTEIVDWAFNYFEKQKYGYITAISSVAGMIGYGFSPSYHASKAYQINYLEGIRQKTFKHDLSIKVIDIRPGFVDTCMSENSPRFWVISKKIAARRIYNAILSGRNVAYISRRWKLLAFILSILPIWATKLLLNKKHLLNIVYFPRIKWSASSINH